LIDRIFEYLPRGNMLEDHAWRNRHRIVLWVLAIHLPVLLGFGLALRSDPGLLAQALGVPLLCLVAGYLIQGRRSASIVTTAGLTWCSAALVVITRGSIEAHFHFFIIIGFIALYQDWFPFLWNIVFTVVSHGVGSAFPTIQMFNHPAGQTNPWVWSGIHGVGVLAACIGLVIFWRVSEQDQQARARLAHRLAEAEIGRRRFTSELLTNLARRNQSMLYRQLEIINQLEENERDPDALAELFKLDHLATRVRRNAESLMVLAGETPARVWSAPVPLREVLQAAIAETEDLERVRFTVDERLAVAGHTVTDLTHLLAELTENAVRFSPPQTRVTISGRPLPQRGGAQLLTIEDWGLGMRPEVIQETNRLLSHPPEVDLSVSQRLGFHVVARLAQRHGIEVSLTPTPGTGVTAVVVLPPELFASTSNGVPVTAGGGSASANGAPVWPALNGSPIEATDDDGRTAGWPVRARPRWCGRARTGRGTDGGTTPSGRLRRTLLRWSRLRRRTSARRRSAWSRLRRRTSAWSRLRRRTSARRTSARRTSARRTSARRTSRWSRRRTTFPGRRPARPRRRPTPVAPIG
jgi:signal transduction histidine kinase